MFEELFGRRQTARPRRGVVEPVPGDDAEAELEVDLRDAVLGAEREIAVNRQGDERRDLPTQGSHPTGRGNRLPRAPAGPGRPRPSRRRARRPVPADHRPSAPVGAGPGPGPVDGSADHGARGAGRSRGHRADVRGSGEAEDSAGVAERAPAPPARPRVAGFEGRLHRSPARRSVRRPADRPSGGFSRRRGKRRPRCRSSTNPTCAGTSCCRRAPWDCSTCWGWADRKRRCAACRRRPPRSSGPRRTGRGPSRSWAA